MLIAVRNSQPTAPSFLAEASERLNNKLARIAWSVLARSRIFEASKLQAV